MGGMLDILGFIFAWVVGLILYGITFHRRK